MTVRLYIWQRLTAALLLLFIVGHLVTLFLATSHGLTAADILARTRGNLAWGLFYSLFVILAAIHGAIGLRTVAREWMSLGRRGGQIIMWGWGLVALILGLRAVAAVVMS